MILYLRLDLSLKLGILLGIFLGVSISAAFGQKTDVLLFKNGDRLIGEVKKLQGGYLRYNTENIGNQDIQWEDIQSLKTDKYMLIQLENGLILEGYMDFRDTNDILITTDDSSFTISAEQITRLFRLKNNLWQRFDWDIGAGLDFTRSTNLLQLSTFSDISYRGPTFQGDLEFNNIFTRQFDDTLRYSKRNLEVRLNRIFRKSWLVYGSYELEQNSELGYDIRHILGTGAGYNILRSQRMDLSASAGAVYNRERFKSDDSGNTSGNNFEAVVGAKYSFYKFKDPEITITMGSTYYGSFTDKGRHRINSNGSIAIEVIDDLDIGLRYLDNVDTKIPETGKRSHDYTISTTISYSF